MSKASVFRCASLILAGALLALNVSDRRALAQSAAVSVWTNHNDNARTGANLLETQLNTATVNATSFGKLFSHAVDAMAFAQPLYIPNVVIPGSGPHNVVYIATMNDSVYAFDADNADGANALPLWHVNFTDPAAGIIATPTPNPKADGSIGILSTPVIDQTTQTMYVLARTRESGQVVQRLHALEIQTGAEKLGGPVVVAARVPGTGVDSVGGQITFNPAQQVQRPGLALANGLVYVAWASWNDVTPYHGWIMSFDASTLALVSAFNTTPDGSMAGIWQSGQPPTFDDSGNLYVATGNGDWNGVRNFGESVLKLSPSLSLLDWFTPDNYATLNALDRDLGVSGPMVIPGSSFVVQGSKQGVMYLLQQNNLGHEAAGNTQIPQVLTVQVDSTMTHHIHSSPIFWDSPNHGPLTYVWAENDFLKAYHFNGVSFDPTPLTQSTFTGPTDGRGMPGGILSLSANGRTSGSGIVWANIPRKGDAENALVPGVLRAFDAEDLSHELWNSSLNLARDDPGLFAKFSPPTIAAGKVYLASFSNEFNVYGLLSTTPDFAIAASPQVNWIAPQLSVGYTFDVSYLRGLSGSTTFAVGGLPSGILASFSPSNALSGSGRIGLNLTATGSPSPGMYALTVTGTNGTASHTATVTLVVTEPGTSAPVVDQIVSIDGTSPVSTPAFSTSATGETLLAFAASDGPASPAQTLTVSGAGLNWSLVERAHGQNGTSEIWQATAPTLLTGVTVTATQTQPGSGGLSLTVMAFANAAGVGASAGASAATGAPAVTLQAPHLGSLFYAVGIDWDSPIERVPGINQSIVHQWLNTSSGITFWVQQRLDAVSAAASSVGLDDVAPIFDQWNLAGAEVLSAGPPQVTASLTFPLAGATGVDLSQPMTWTPIPNAQAYYLYVGTTTGAKDLVDTGEIQQTSYLVTSVGGNQTVFVRLWTKVGGVWRYSDSSFTSAPVAEPPPIATLTYPTNGATGVDLAQPLTWTVVSGAQAYYLYVGTTPGAKDLVDTGEIQNTFYLATSLPHGQLIYVRLWTKVAGTWRFVDAAFSTA